MKLTNHYVMLENPFSLPPFPLQKDDTHSTCNLHSLHQTETCKGNNQENDNEKITKKKILRKQGIMEKIYIKIIIDNIVPT